MNRISLCSVLWVSLSACQTYANEHGFPALNTIGRYLGVGWSHHTYHSQVDGRFDIISHRHPACAYPSRALSSIYSTNHNSIYIAPQSLPADFWQVPSIVDRPKSNTPPHQSILESDKRVWRMEPKKADELPDRRQQVPPSNRNDASITKEPLPGWLEPYMEDERTKKKDSVQIELESSPSDRASAAIKLNPRRR